MLKLIRAIVVAVVVAVSLLGSTSLASADQTPGRGPHRTPPAQVLDITWE
jgi:hypothetical protein